MTTMGVIESKRISIVSISVYKALQLHMQIWGSCTSVSLQPVWLMTHIEIPYILFCCLEWEFCAGLKKKKKRKHTFLFCIVSNFSIVKALTLSVHAELCWCFRKLWQWTTGSLIYVCAFFAESAHCWNIYVLELWNKNVMFGTLCVLQTRRHIRLRELLHERSGDASLIVM